MSPREARARRARRRARLVAQEVADARWLAARARVRRRVALVLVGVWVAPWGVLAVAAHP